MDDPELAIFEKTVAHFIVANASPNIVATWRENGIVDRDIWKSSGDAGLLGLTIPSEYGGSGGDFRHEVILAEQLGRAGIEGWDVTLHNAVIAPYIVSFGTDEQKRRWLPRVSSGELVLAIAMTEPGTGSDLQAIRTSAVRDGDYFIIDGSKTFISNGQLADLILVVVRTHPGDGAKGLSLIAVEPMNTTGFARGRNLHKIGRDYADTSELFFTSMRVPVANLIGTDGAGFSMLMNKLPQERLVIAVQALAAIEHVLALTIDYVKHRRAFGKAILDFQNTQFVLAECKTEAVMVKTLVDRCVELLIDGRLDATMASMAKYAATEAQGRIVDRCLQLFGGYGYMSEYPIAQAFKDARVTRLYGGTSEIMKLLIARSL